MLLLEDCAPRGTGFCLLPLLTHWALIFKKETEHLRVEAGRKGVQMRAQYGCYVFAVGCCMTQIRPQRHLRGLPLLPSYSYIDGLAASEGDFEPTMIYG